jgi:hypothetical protein
MVSKKTSMHRRRKTTKHRCGTSECAHATHHGLAAWYKHLFEDLGWMVLAKHRGMNDKVNVYMHSLHRFKNSVEYKITTTHEADRKEDLKIMHANICILLAHAEKDFM